MVGWMRGRRSESRRRAGAVLAVLAACGPVSGLAVLDQGEAAAAARAHTAASSGRIAAPPGYIAAPPGYIEDSSIAYEAAHCKVAGSGSQTVGDVYRPYPAPTGALPAIVLVHGGSFVSGSRSASTWPAIARDLATLGYVAYDIDYCYAGGTRAGYEFQVPDVEAAVRALTTAGFDNSLVNVDRTRVATWGGSAGATLAVEAAVELGTTDPSSPVAAMVGWSGGYDFLDYRGANGHNQAGPQAFVGCDPRVTQTRSCHAAAEEASAAHEVQAGSTPPMSLWNSIQELVPVYQFRDMATALTRVGIPFEKHLNRGAYAHAHATDYTTVAFCPTVSYISRYLGQPAPLNCKPPAS